MTEAEKAFAVAERWIEEAWTNGAETLRFDRAETGALERLPEGIGTLDALRKLDCENTQISDLSPLSGLVNLTELWLDNTQVSELGVLSGLVNLTTLYLNNTQVSDLGALSGLENLAVLGLENTRVSDLGALSGLVNLEALYLDNTQVLDLRPIRVLRKLAEDPAPSGLTFKNCAAARSDPRIAEIAEIEDEKERARTLFDYLAGILVEIAPPGAVEAEPQQNAPVPSTPTPQVAPLLTDFVDGRLIRVAPDRLPEHDPLTRAKMGWEALKAYRESFGDSFSVHNYAPLPSLLKAFDKAMGDAFDPKQMIMIGVMGSRIVGLSADKAFLENLPVGADTDLRGFAAEISTYLNRFPDWLDYTAEAEASEVTAQDTKAEAEAFRELSEALSDTDAVEAEVAQEYAAEVAAATGEDADDAVAEGVAATTREWVREVSEKGLEEVKRGRVLRENLDKMDDVADGEFAKVQFWSYGWTLVLLKRNQAPLRRLALKFPKKLGWLGPVLDYLVGEPPK
jgi:hypothetical protein